MGSLDSSTAGVGVPTPQGQLINFVTKTLFNRLFGGGSDRGGTMTPEQWAVLEQMSTEQTASTREMLRVMLNDPTVPASDKAKLEQLVKWEESGQPIPPEEMQAYLGMPQDIIQNIWNGTQQSASLWTPEQTQAYNNAGSFQGDPLPTQTTNTSESVLDPIFNILYPDLTNSVLGGLKIGSKGERWLPDGSLILSDGNIMKPNGQVVNQSGQPQSQQPSIINESIQAAGGRPESPAVLQGTQWPTVNGQDIFKILYPDMPSSLPTTPTQQPTQQPAQTPTQPQSTQTGQTTSQGTSSTNTGENGSIFDVLQGLPVFTGNTPTEGTPVTGGNNMSTLDDIFEAITGGLKTAGDFLKGSGGQALATGLGGAATIYNINQQKEAAEEMAKAMNLATGTQREMFDLTRSDLAPYRLSPQGAAGAAGFSTSALPNVDLSQSGGTPLNTAALTDPSRAIYGGAGNLPTPTVAGDFTQGLPDPTNYNDPAYEWMRDEGMRSIQNASAARGRLNSGTTLEELNRMGVGLAGEQMSRVAALRNQLFGERMGQQAQQFNQGLGLRGQLFGEGLAGSELQFGQLSDRERMEMSQQMAQFEQQNLLQQQNIANTLQLRQTLFGEQLSADELDFLQRYNMAAMGANAAAGAGNAAMQYGQNSGEMAMNSALLQGASSAGRSQIINDFIKSLFV